MARGIARSRSSAAIMTESCSQDAGYCRVERKANPPRFLHGGGVGRDGCGEATESLWAGVADGVGVGVEVGMGVQWAGVGRCWTESQVSLKYPLLS
jgi:hypothetical protein